MSQNKPIKPWYKRWWIWLLAIIIVIIGFNSIGSDSDSSSSSSDDTSSSSTKKSVFDKTYKVGQTVSYKGYSFKVNKVNFYNGNEIDTPDSGKRYVIANVTIKNNGKTKQDYNSYDFQLNANGNSQDWDETLTEGPYADAETIDSGTLDKGATVTGNLIGQAKTNAKLKLEYKPSFWDDKTLDISLN